MSKSCWVGLLEKLFNRGQVPLTSLFTSYTLLFIICPFPGYLPGQQMGWPEGEQPGYNCERRQSYAKNGRKGWIHHPWTSFPCTYHYTRKINPLLIKLSCCISVTCNQKYSVRENNPDFNSIKIVTCLKSKLFRLKINTIMCFLPLYFPPPFLLSPLIVKESVITVDGFSLDEVLDSMGM